MATTLNAGTTAATALNVITDTTGAMAIQTSGTTAIAISSAQVVSLTNALAVTSGGTGVTTSTGSGANVLGTSPTLTTPTLVTPALGTPASGTLTNATGLPLTTGVTGTLPVANGGTGTTSTTFANLATNVTGTLPVANGGTGAATHTSKGVLIGNGTSAVTTVSPSTSGNVLTSDGTSWASSAPANSVKCWVNFNGTLSTPITPRGSLNVTNITKNGTGDYTINFTNALANTNYATFISIGPTQGTVADCAVITSYTTSSVRISTYYLSGTSKAAADYTTICVSNMG